MDGQEANLSNSTILYIENDSDSRKRTAAIRKINSTF